MKNYRVEKTTVTDLMLCALDQGFLVNAYHDNKKRPVVMVVRIHEDKMKLVSHTTGKSYVHMLVQSLADSHALFPSVRDVDAPVAKKDLTPLLVQAMERGFRVHGGGPRDKGDTTYSVMISRDTDTEILVLAAATEEDHCDALEKALTLALERFGQVVPIRKNKV
ncbi:hypothetical protein Illi2_00206 [Pseudomonas phage vB_PpuM-Illi-2]